jgi:hypothetical protein
VVSRFVFVTFFALTGCGARTDLGVAEQGACGASPETATILTTVGDFEKFRKPTAITVSGSTLYYSVNDGSNNPFALERLSTGGGAPIEILGGATGCAYSPFAYGPLVTDGTYLYTPDEEMVTTCTGLTVHISRIDPKTGATMTLPNPIDGHPRGVGQVRTSARHGVLWLSPVTFLDNANPGTTLLARWDGTSTHLVGVIEGAAYAFVLAGDQVFVETGTTLWKMPIDGSGAPAAVGFVDDKFRFAGSNGEGDHVFYTRDGTTILSRDVASGFEQVLATDGGGGFGGNGDSMWADDAWVYFVRTPQRDLARVPVIGGEVEVLSPDETRDGVNGIVTDACNVYWIADTSFTDNLPPAVYVRAR